ncbi:MAG: single-stranded-DNA-specific exonuclease RecJ [Chloroflexota bacterium]
MKQWIDPLPITIPETLAHDIAAHPIVAETLVRRGFTTSAAAREFMFWHHYTPASPNELPNIDRAVQRLKRAIASKELICIWGDFDVDGQTSTALLLSALRDLGANAVSYIPQRLTEGHGITVPSLKRQIDGGAQLILTCDTGIDEHEAIDYANSRGVDVVITDHHKLPETLPDAFAAVNPRMTPKDHPLRDLPGVGVAYLLICALAPERDWSHLLDLVALGIVADVAMQRKDTRYLLQRGLAVLADTKRPGLQEMMRLAHINPADVNEDSIGFSLAPRLNAIGRLDDANPTTELLTSHNLERARLLANRLEGFNAERRRLSDAVWQGVQAELEREPALLKHAALVVAHPEWHTGVVGIVANRCVEAYMRPALLLKSPPDAPARGSARSIAGVDITDAIAENASLLRGYGGHTMAAGIEIDTEHIDDFRRGLSISVRAQLTGLDLTPSLQIDRYMTLAEIDETLVKDVARIAPFGAGNPPLTLATTGLTIKRSRQLGSTDKHMEMTVEDDVGTQRRVVWWNADEIPSGRLDMAYTIRENTYRGKREIQIELLDYRIVAPDAIEVRATQRQNIQFTDYRSTPNPPSTLGKIRQSEPRLLVWGEVVADKSIGAVNRQSLQQSPALAVWSAPPSADIWNRVLDTVQPERVYLFNNGTGMDERTAFLQRLAGLAKYTISAKNGETTIAALAAATAQREEVVAAGLDWLAGQGQITVTHADNDVTITAGGAADQPDASRLQTLLREGKAYREYWASTPVDNLRG